ncbi:type II secretion system GspH family protein [bacterium]|nr:type II secretion system GspH family protein [bacterium]
MRRVSKRRAFTLVEILVVISILIVLVGLIATTARLGLNFANASASRVLIETLSSALEEKMKTYYNTNLANPNIGPYIVWAGLDASYSQAVEPNSSIGQRAAVIARMDSLRSAFPQSFAEIIPGENVVLALGVNARPPFTNSTTASDHVGFVERMRQAFASMASVAPGEASVIGIASAPLVAPDPAMQDIMIGYLLATKQIANKSEFSFRQGYRNIEPGVAGSWSAIPHRDGSGQIRQGIGVHSPETESSECLYLILEKDPAIQGVSAKFIKDTDGDGLLEFVDSYGKPIKFYRAAPDLYAYWIEVTQQYRSASTARINLARDGGEDEPVGDNTFDSQNVLYEYPTDDASSFTPTNEWWIPGGSDDFGQNFGRISHKQVFEMFLGRLHRAYNRVSPFSYSDPVAIDPTQPYGLQQSSGRNENLGQDVPRPYPFRSMIVSAGGDGEFGLYSTTTDIDGNGVPDITHPALHMGLKGGRVEEDPDRRAKVRDNIYSVKLLEGLQQ